ncbi:MAG TPA: NifU N-terminal domain-containing protein [Tepidisphaeraceae bacterium]|nr:NifU N-terminal domain-containing protein [Tepidisphaeraceae bacterium]
MAFRVLEIQATPNPNAVKFVLDRPIVQNPTSFFNAAAATGYPIAEQLFAIPGVASLLLLGDFVTVNKTADAAWPQITPKVKQVLSQV